MTRPTGVRLGSGTRRRSTSCSRAARSKRLATRGARGGGGRLRRGAARVHARQNAAMLLQFLGCRRRSSARVQAVAETRDPDMLKRRAKANLDKRLRRARSLL